MNRVSQLLGGAAVIAIAVVFVVQFRPGATRTARGPGITCAVEIRGSCIQSTDFWASYGLLAGSNPDKARMRAMGLRRQTAEGLYERWLLNEDAKRLGITVSEDDVTAELVAGRIHVSLPAEKADPRDKLVRYFQVKNRQTKKFDNKMYEREVRTRARMSPSDFREYQKKELIAARMRDLVRARVRVGETEAFERFSRVRSTRTVDYIRFDRSFYGDLFVDTSDRAVQAWADQNKEELDKVWENKKSQFLPECRVTRHVLARLKEGPETSEADKAAAKAKIEGALSRIKKGEDFAEVARSLSDDTSASRGGELGCVAKGRMVKPFEDKVFELKAGDVSDVVETEFGYHVIKVEQIAKDADAEKIGRAQTALELYLSHESERLAAEAAKQVLAAVGGGKSLKEALDAHLASLTPAKAADDKKKGDKKKDGAKAKKDDKKDEDEGEEKSGEENAPLTADTHPHRPTVETSIPFNLAGDPIPSAKSGSEAARIAFELGKPGDIPKDVVPLEGGYAVMQLKESTPATQEQWAKERENVMSIMRSQKQSDALVGYIRRLRGTIGSEVKYDQGLITEPKDKDSGEPSPEPMPEEEE